AVNQQVYTTAAIAPAPNTLVTLAVMGHNATTATPSPTVTGGGMSTWTEVASTTFHTVSSPHTRLTIFRAMSPAPGSGPITIRFNHTVSRSQWIVSQWEGAETSGVNGAGAIVQTGSRSGDAVSGLTVPLAPFGNSNDVAYGVFGVAKNTAAVTPGAGFTEISEQPSAESTPSDLEAEFAPNLNTVAATWTSLNGAALGVEIKAGLAAGVDPAQSTVSASPTSITPEGAAATITVAVKDGSGNPMSGVTVELFASGSGNTLTQPEGSTDANGEVTGALGSTVAETKTVSARANGALLTQTAVVTVTPGPASAATSTVAAWPDSIPGGSSVSKITVTAKDANGAPLRGVTVVLAATGTGNTVTQPVGPTDANGVATGTLSSTVAGTKTVSATANGTVITQTAAVTVTAGPVSAAVST